MSTIKQIIIEGMTPICSNNMNDNINNNPTKKKEITNKKKGKRKITLLQTWVFSKDDFFLNSQIEMCNHIHTASPLHLKMKKEINSKLYSYKHQDIKKKIYNKVEFITFEQTIQKLIDSNFKCFYCNQNVNILYEEVRDPTQWSLERIDNTFGHNCSNVVIACLNCNLRRRTMYYERYVQTKQLLHIIKSDSTIYNSGKQSVSDEQSSADKQLVTGSPVLITDEEDD